MSSAISLRVEGQDQDVCTTSLARGSALLRLHEDHGVGELAFVVLTDPEEDDYVLVHPTSLVSGKHELVGASLTLGSVDVERLRSAIPKWAERSVRDEPQIVAEALIDAIRTHQLEPPCEFRHYY